MRRSTLMLVLVVLVVMLQAFSSCPPPFSSPPPPCSDIPDRPDRPDRHSTDQRDTKAETETDKDRDQCRHADVFVECRHVQCQVCCSALENPPEQMHVPSANASPLGRCASPAQMHLPSMRLTWQTSRHLTRDTGQWTCSPDKRIDLALLHVE